MKNKRIAVTILLLFCILSVVCMIIALRHTGKQSVAFTPPPFDAAAQTGMPQVPDELGWSEVEAPDVFSAHICGNVTVTGQSADIYFTNSADNHVWLKLRVLDSEGNILGETGLLKPGQYVQKISFSLLPQTDTEITMKIMAYEPETYYSAGAVSLITRIEVIE